MRPTVLEYTKNNNIAGILKLIEARQCYGNQYYVRIPSYIGMAIFEILDDDITLADYLEQVVLHKLRRLAGLPIERKKQKLGDFSNLGRELDEDDLLGDNDYTKKEDVDMVTDSPRIKTEMDKDAMAKTSQNNLSPRASERLEHHP